LLYATAVGFVAAGSGASLYQLVTHRQAAFAVPKARFISCVAAVASYALVGPYIVATNALRTHFVDKRPLKWMAAGLGLAVLWSACSGIVVLDFALAVRG
jgi:hypothetical protein